jgi:uncharacterized protein YecE (DUF72 family)
MKKLKDAEAGLDRFFSRVDLLGSKLGPVLFQLPPNWHCDEGGLRSFLEALPRCHNNAFEFRDPSWNNAEISKVLEQFGAAYCIFDLAGFQSPLTFNRGFHLHPPAWTGRALSGQL